MFCPRPVAFGPRPFFLYNIRMVTPSQTYRAERAPKYAGLRMSADEYLALDDDGFRYEVVDGLVVPSADSSLFHQALLTKILIQIEVFLQASQIGKVVPSIDIRFSADLVYRPDICFYLTGHLAPNPKRLETPPDFIIEVVSPGSRAIDTRTKRDDYERFGVREYWTIDSQTLQVQRHLLRDGTYTVATPPGDAVPCEVISGFSLDLKPIREALAND